MNDEVARWVLLVEVAILAPIGLYHRLRANTGERLDRRQEGWLFLFSLRPLGILFLIAFMVFTWQPRWMAWSRLEVPGVWRVMGVGLMGIGGALLTWTVRTLGHNLTDTVVTRRAATLVTSGPYRYVRHPFYLAFALLVVANALVASNWFVLLSGLACFGMMVARAPIEERKLVARFGKDYAQYAQRTGRFVPRIVSGTARRSSKMRCQSSSRPWGWSELIVFLFTVGYLVPFANICLHGGNREFLLYLVVMLTIIPMVAWLHRRIQLHAGTLWGLSLWGLAHLAGGLIQTPYGWSDEEGAVLYNLWLIPETLRYDQLVHAFGFGLTTWLCWQGLRAGVQNVEKAQLEPTCGFLALCVLSGMGLGALNEMIEFLAVLTIPNTNVGGYENTGWDLVFNALGSLFAAISIRMFDRRK